MNVKFFLSLGLALATATAGPIAFSGSGGSGNVAPGSTPWSITSTSWSIPGVGLGTTAWNGPAGYTDFHIVFTGLPGGVSIDSNFASNCSGVLTGMCSEDGPWSAVLDSANAVSFYTPLGTSLDPGEQFFVNIYFTGGSITTVDFTGSFTDTAGVPEPSTLLLGSVGLLAAGVVRRRYLKRF